ncbi:MAG: orotate phosphoribosyltransferase [Gammaproteobacteria bacterium]|nr:orotate phosphoribosyltransferase [Gammaproteobacteria bacterium]
MNERQKRALLALMIEREVLTFGEFTLKSGRQSPYFFNLGSIDSGRAMQRLGESYADHLEGSGLEFDVVFGPAYKGIPIAVATGLALARKGEDVGIAFNRKEIKNHGEGGQFVGAAVTGRVLIVDDVLTAGTAIREAVQLVREVGGEITGVVIALDRQELNQSGRTAVADLEDELGVPVTSLLCLADVIEYLDLSARGNKDHEATLAKIRSYQQAHCAGQNHEARRAESTR